MGLQGDGVLLPFFHYIAVYYFLIKGVRSKELGVLPL